jgi:hypothetical protein
MRRGSVEGQAHDRRVPELSRAEDRVEGGDQHEAEGPAGVDPVESRVRR